MKLKICGMKYPENITDVSSLLPDYIGFIFWEKSSRFCNVAIPKLPPSIQKIGVFVDADFDYIQTIIKQHDLQGIQLHGSESPEFCLALKQLGLPIIKAFAIDADFDFKQLDAYEIATDYYLFDTKGKLPGGNGMAFNWSILNKYTSTKNLFLSGGIGPDSVTELKKLQVPIHAVDVNSQFEVQPGLKNKEALQLFQKNLNRTP